MTKRIGFESESVSTWNGSADPDRDPNPYQNATDPEHWQQQIRSRVRYLDTNRIVSYRKSYR
jgi:hypothetical protein